jgi:hypothetical protein
MESGSARSSVARHLANRPTCRSADAGRTACPTRSKALCCCLGATFGSPVGLRRSPARPEGWPVNDHRSRPEPTRRTVYLAIASLALSGACYQATVETGVAPSGQVIEHEWAPSFSGGLVSPDAMETAAKCPNGVAKAETQLSFLNMVADAVTFGI